MGSKNQQTRRVIFYWKYRPVLWGCKTLNWTLSLLWGAWMWDNSVCAVWSQFWMRPFVPGASLGQRPHTQGCMLFPDLWCIEQRKLARQRAQQVPQRMSQPILGSLWWVISRRIQLCSEIVRTWNSVNFALPPLSLPPTVRQTPWRVWLNWVTFSNKPIHHPPEPYLFVSGIVLFTWTAQLWRKKKKSLN